MKHLFANKLFINSFAIHLPSSYNIFFYVKYKKSFNNKHYKLKHSTKESCNDVEVFFL